MRMRLVELAFVAAVASVAANAQALPGDDDLALATLSAPPVSAASPREDSARDATSVHRDVRGEVPIFAYTYAARGAPARSVGAQGYGLGLAATGQDVVLGGGAMIWWAPIERLTLTLDAPRNAWGRFSPSAAGAFRVLGGRDPVALALLGKFKVEGFAEGPDHDEVESEVEVGALFGFARSGWHLDANAIAGFGTGEEGEKDVEARLRLARDLGRLVALGVDGQARLRVGGPRTLPNGRTWDAAAGTQVVVGTSGLFGSFTAGPATQGLVSTSVGMLAMLAVGGTT